MPLSVDTGHNKAALRDEVELLRKHLHERNSKDTALMQARDSAESRRPLRTKAAWDNKIYAEKAEFNSSRQENLERVARYEKTIAEQEARIKALESEVAALKEAAARAPETLSAFLARLGLSTHLAALEEEELDVGLLRSMGRDELAGNMASLGLSAADAQKIVHDLHPPAPVSWRELELSFACDGERLKRGELTKHYMQRPSLYEP